MPNQPPRYFELDPERTPHIPPDEPIAEQGLTIAVPATVRGDEIVFKPKKITLRPLDGHPRVLRVSDPIVAEKVLELGFYREIDPPESERPRRPRERPADPTAQEAPTS